ncbi:uncharacterized protein LOC142985211 [Anticarsia gemmatalis]|uniref:uncharacterized protein LOC142985211 n=1 Tax=Anticarsia gemmatalis TaxID=129554 RepID=UPI003F7666B7
MDPPSENDTGLRSSVAWKFFSKKNETTATCNACHKDYSYSSTVSNLVRHWQRKHRDVNVRLTNDDTTDCSDEEWDSNSESKKEVTKTEPAKDRDDDESGREETEMITITNDNADKQKRRKQSIVWRFMSKNEGDSKHVTCLICKTKLSHSGLSNLKKHLIRKHPEFNLEDEARAKRMILSEDGQLYEIGESDCEVDPINTQEWLLPEDLIEDNKSPERKKPKLLKKRKRNSYEPKDTSDDDISTTVKRPVKSSVKNDSLEHFGHYIVSLLRQLPSQVSDQLQCDITKQILMKKIELSNPRNETQNKVSVVEITEMPNETDLNNHNDLIIINNVKK